MRRGTGIRRVVTGFDAAGRSIVALDGPSPRRLETTPGGIILTELWVTHDHPETDRGADAADRPVSITPPAGGTVFRYVEYPPDAEYAASWDPAAAWQAMGGHAPEQQRDRSSHRHPGFHQTDTVDYIVVVEGEIWALLETGEVLLRQGDCLVQRGTNHAWSNRSDRRAVLAAVLIDARDHEG